MTVSDTLETIFKVVGANNLTASLNQAAAATSKVAAAQAATTGAQAQGVGAAASLTSSLGGLLNAQTALVTALGAAAVGVLKQSLQVFAEDEQAIFRTTVVLRNLGNSYPIEKAQAFASSIQKSVAVDDEAVVALIGLEKRFGIADNQIEKTTRTILDFSKATGIGLEEAGQIVGRALLGQTRGLKALGIEFTATGDKAKDLITIQNKLNNLFGGAAQAERNTLAGTFTALKESFNNLLSALGEKLAAVLIPLLNGLIKVIDFVTATLPTFLDPFGVLKRPNAAENIGNGKGRLATEDTLKEVAANTKSGNEAIVKAVLGGPLSQFARGGANARDFQLAFRA